MRLVILAALSASLLTIGGSDQHSVWFEMQGGPYGGHGGLSEAYTDARGFAGRSANDIWAVGIRRGPGGDGANQPRVQHWDGVRWSAVPVQAAGGSPDVLTSIATVSSREGWAVGYSAGVGGLEERALIERWDGGAWTVSHQSPSPVGLWNELDGVVALSAKDAWAVGYTKGAASPAHVLIEHWNGIDWRVVDAPSPGTNWNQLAAVSGTGPHDVWAVGWQQSEASFQPLIEHWDGIRWSVMAAAPGGSRLQSVSAVSPTLAWAVDTSGGTERWDGRRWSMMPAPPRAQSVELWGISASAPDDAWLVGARIGRGYGPLLEHWDGAAWTIIDAPGGIGAGRLTAVLSVSKNDVWIAGTRQSTQPLTLVEHWDGRSWSIVDR